jgi:hypothetical protein
MPIWPQRMQNVDRAVAFVRPCVVGRKPIARGPVADNMIEGFAVAVAR